MIWVGVDPGLSGACGAISVSDMGQPEFIDVMDLPVIPDGNTQRQINCEALGRWFEKIGPDTCIIENVQPMPSVPGLNGQRRSMGATSAFRFGFACGQIRGCVQAYQIKCRLVHPVSWKRHFELKGPDKEQSRLMALKLLPAAGDLLKLKKSHNRAESLLIALYGADQLAFI